MITTTSSTVTDYIAGFPENIQVLLEQVRETVKQAAPEALETIKYAMPTYVLHGNLVHFAAFKNHIGLYATPNGHEAFSKELSVYKGAKGSVQFPLDQPLPLSLIARIVEFRVKQNTEKALQKNALKTCENGHTYHKTSDCPTCPVCEQERNPQNSFLALLGAPARRALENQGITTLAQLATYSEKELLRLHGIGKSSIPKMREALAQEKLAFKN